MRTLIRPFQVPEGEDERLGEALEARLNELEDWAEDFEHA